MTPDTLRRRLSQPQQADIDELYGLEPVYEPGDLPGARPEEFVAIQCPWCGERLETRIDLTAGEQRCIEDCEVCCQPMELGVELEDSGALRAVRVQRVD
jgi:hypothetical protein